MSQRTDPSISKMLKMQQLRPEKSRTKDKVREQLDFQGIAVRTLTRGESIEFLRNSIIFQHFLNQRLRVKPKDTSPQKVNAAKTLKRLQYSHLNLIWDMALGLKDTRQQKVDAVPNCQVFSGP